MKVSEKQLKQALVDSDIISKKDFEKAKKKAKEKKGKKLTDILVEDEYISDENLGRLIADILDYRFVNLNQQHIEEEILRIIPEPVAKKQGVIAFDKAAEGLKVGMLNPSDLEIIQFLEKKTGEEVVPYFVTERDFKEALGEYHKEIQEDFIERIKERVTEIKGGRPEDISVIKLVDSIIEYGYQNRASDVHIEPYEEKILVRYRIDGVLHDVVELPKAIHSLVVTRIKIMAKLRTDEHRAAQDGKMQAKIGDRKVDIRVSVVPITEGEKVVLRILSEKARQFTLEDLGLLKGDLKKVKENIKKPWGMILATGPTGCGKTTTLYSILKILNQREVNIATIEDPVEYDIEGVNQIQVNPQTNLTFVKGLRSILRQDPDIIMVGEIRDNETADLAVNSAMTGHLVLSTMHANDAATTLPRLFDMGIEPFLISSTVNVVIAQRLVRTICPKCRASHTLTKEEESLIEKQPQVKRIINKFRKNKKARVYKGKGCSFCGHTGYKGRIGIFEVMDISEQVKELIMQRANSDEIRKQAVKEGMALIIEDGVKKMLNGITTLEEVLRATKE